MRRNVTSVTGYFEQKKLRFTVENLIVYSRMNPGGGRGGGGGYCPICAIQVYAAVKGVVFKQLTLG